MTARFAGRSSVVVVPSPFVLLTSTFKSFNSGRYRAIGSLILKTPCSTSIIAATVTIGLVIDAMRNMLSFAIGLALAAS